MKKNVARIVIFTLFILFLALYFTQTTGYYEFENKRATELTKEQIEKFEEDVKNGKDVDATDYLNIDKKDYDNKLSDASLSISEKIEDIFNKGMEKLFGALEGAMNS